jgi:hypothetical protein
MTSKLWQRINDWLARHFRREIPPGRFEGDAKFALSGWLVSHPLVWPRREYLVYVPRGWSRWRRAPPLVCHGESRQAFAGGPRPPRVTGGSADGWSCATSAWRSLIGPWPAGSSLELCA